MPSRQKTTARPQDGLFIFTLPRPSARVRPLFGIPSAPHYPVQQMDVAPTAAATPTTPVHPSPPTPAPRRVHARERGGSRDAYLPSTRSVRPEKKSLFCAGPVSLAVRCSGRATKTAPKIRIISVVSRWSIKCRRGNGFTILFLLCFPPMGSIHSTVYLIFSTTRFFVRV